MMLSSLGACLAVGLSVLLGLFALTGAAGRKRRGG
jgi:hypothetical protein